MDLLAGYGSGSESDQEDLQHEIEKHEPEGGAPQEPAPVLFQRLPAPAASAKTMLFSGLPKPAPKKKNKLFATGGGFRAMDYGEVPDAGAEEDYVPKKKLKTSVQSDVLGEVLPAPKNEPAGSNKKLDIGSIFDEPRNPTTATGTGVNAAPPLPAVAPNELYRVDRPPPAAAYAYAAADPYPAAPSHPGMSSSYAAAPPADPAQVFLNAALEAERAKAGLQGGGVDALEAAAGIQFKEVNADRIRYMDPASRAEVNALREALGNDYEQKLRAEAGKVGSVSKLAKSRHQLASLFVQAKHQELEQIEKRVTGMKSKAETAKKYGW